MKKLQSNPAAKLCAVIVLLCAIFGAGVFDGDGPGGDEPGALLRPAQGGVPPQLALYPGDDLQGVEGLGDVVVRPDVQAQDLVGVLAFNFIILNSFLMIFPIGT